MEKHAEANLPHPVQEVETRKPSRGWRLVATVAAGLLMYFALGAADDLIDSLKPKHHHKYKLECPVQPSALPPATVIDWSDESKAASIELFRAAVRIPTQSYDDNGEPEEDPRWAPFKDFQKWLEEAFPTAWKAAKIEFINTLGIVATFEGSDSSLKPLLLMSHYDVVPAPESTYDRWTHKPFDADLADGFVWGRGASDDKSLLVSQWEAMTHLLEGGFKPRRTVILSHGFDEEEVHARRGQGQIAPFLEERYGHNGLLMVVDEGTGIVDDFLGAPFALPAMGEKGYLDILIKVGTTGGHSSVAPKHTGIGITSQLVTALEDHPFETKLTKDSPILTGLMCAAKHSKSFPKKWTHLLRQGPKGWTKLSREYARESNLQRALVSTTTAVDVVNGGVKVNALPELVTTMVNFRIDFSESLSSTKEHVEKLLRRVATKHDLDFFAWEGGNATAGMERFVSVDVLGAPLEPAPNTPAHGGVWDLFAGTVKAVMPGPNGEERVVAPFASTGNTDCKMYYNLSRNVYRFMGAPDGAGQGVHTVDERFSADGHIFIVNWIHALVQNVDAYDGEQ